MFSGLRSRCIFESSKIVESLASSFPELAIGVASRGECARHAVSRLDEGSVGADLGHAPIIALQPLFLFKLLRMI